MARASSAISTLALIVDILAPACEDPAQEPVVVVGLSAPPEGDVSPARPSRLWPPRKGRVLLTMSATRCWRLASRASACTWVSVPAATAALIFAVRSATTGGIPPSGGLPGRGGA